MMVAARRNNNKVSRRNNRRNRNNMAVVPKFRRPRTGQDGFMKQEMRTLRKISYIKLDNTTGSDTFGRANIYSEGTEFPGWNALADTFDQYQVKRMRVSIFPSSSQVIDPITNLVDLSMTKIFSCLDFDTDNLLDLDDIISRRGMRMQTLSVQKQLVKQFVPRFIRRSSTISEQSGTVNPSVMWWNTAVGTQAFGGLKMYYTNYGGITTHPGPTQIQSIKMMIEWDVAVRGQKFN